MRVISQNGKIDVPYELTAFHECYGVIMMNMAGDTGKGTMMANYSDSEKAQMALHMLHQIYSGRPLVVQNIGKSMEELQKMVINSLHTNLECDYEFTFEVTPTNIVWRFPKEEEI